MVFLDLLAVSEDLIHDIENLFHNCILSQIVLSFEQLGSHNSIRASTIDSFWCIDSSN